MSYLRPAAAVETEIEINRSRFICNLEIVENRQQADQFISAIRERHPKANHHCWSYIAGLPDDFHQWNFSDDGEPKGTAGQPMLNILCHSGMGNICAVVTRYFGGIKLGTGGLVRAYGQSVQSALARCDTETIIPKKQIRLIAPYSLTGELEQLIIQFNLSQCERSFDSDLTVVALIEETRLAELKTALTPHQHLISLKLC